MVLKNKGAATVVLGAGIIVSALIALADPVDLPHVFKNGETADADHWEVMQELKNKTVRDEMHREAFHELSEVVTRHEVEREEAEEKFRLTWAA